MKILHIVWVLKFGGIETMLMNITREQIELGNEVGILLIDKGTADPELVKRKDPKVRMFYANRKFGKWDIPAYIRMNKIISQYNPNAIHLHSAAMYKYLTPMHRKACNVTLHALCNKANTDHIDKIDKVFAISQSVADDLMAKKHVSSIVNPNGISPELIQTKNQSTKDKIFKMVQVSRLDHLKKGQHLLIQACKQLKDDGYTNFKLDFIGEGPSLEFLKKVTNDTEMKEYVNFLGMKDQKYIYNHLCEYDLFVQPSINEGFGLTVAEAMAAKIPVLVSSGQGPEEVIDYGKCGTIFRNGDIEDCASKIKKYMKGEEDKSLVEKAFNRVWNLYNVKTTAKTYIENYARRS